MQKPGIAIIIAGLLTALTISCSLSYADQNEALMEATRKGDLAQVQDLLEKGADVNTRDEYGWTPLTLAAEKGHLEIVKLLITHGANE